MKRIAIYYHSNFGRNDGPPLYYYNQLKQLPDTEVVHIMPEGDTSRFGKFDLHFWVDYGEDGLPVDHDWTIPQDGGKTIYVCSDTHIDEKGKEHRFKKAWQFNHVFFNQKRAYEEFLQEHPKLVYATLTPHWLPHAAEPQAYPHFEIIKKYDVCFIGHFQDVKNYNGFSRVDALDRLFKEFPNFYWGTRNPQKPEANMFEDASRKFCQSKIVFNVSITDDINMRVFETLSSGSFLLTNNLPTLGELFKDGKHLVTYNSLDEMVQKAHYYIEHDDEREQIAQAGHEEFMRNHTYAHRIQQILKIVGNEESDTIMAKGSAVKRDIIKAGDSKRVEEIDVESSVDKGRDYVKPGERA